MSTLKENLDEALDELDERAEKEFGPQDKSPKEAVYNAAKRRIDSDWVGRIAILISFMATIFVGMAVSFLNEQKILTTDGILIIIVGGFIYVGFRMFVVLYNFIALKLQHRAIELDIKEANVRKIEAETDAYETLKKAEIAEKKRLFIKNQDRLDQKLHQDLKLRGPFFQDAQKSMMTFFAREDIVSALQVPPTFVEAVERLDDALLKRSSFDVTVDKMNSRITNMMNKYDDISSQTKENNELLNQLLQRDAELAVKWRETDIGLKQLQQQVASMSTSMDTLMEMFSDSFITGEKSTLPSELPPHGGTDPESKPEPSEDEIAGISTSSISKEVDKLIEEIKEKEEEEEEGLPPPPTD